VQREWAAKNPRATFKTPITVEDVLNSRMIAYPFRPDEARATSLQIVRRLYEEGLRPGNYWGGDFDYWPDEGCQAAIDRIEREWIAAGEDPNLGEPICWFAHRPSCA
jgi:hypothetical protein